MTHPAPVCDFCGLPDPRWLFTSKTFVHSIAVAPDGKVLEYGEDPEWVACDGCKPFVEARDIAALIEHVIPIHTHLGYFSPEREPAQRLALMAIYTGFFEGDPTCRALTDADAAKFHEAYLGTLADKEIEDTFWGR